MPDSKAIQNNAEICQSRKIPQGFVLRKYWFVNKNFSTSIKGKVGVETQTYNDYGFLFKQKVWNWKNPVFSEKFGR